ncbi:MAG: redoxin domain-containing protein [Rhodothermales bacterium]|nr:redoxin domain-containing protein [Rhodothermales bacterium]
MKLLYRTRAAIGRLTLGLMALTTIAAIGVDDYETLKVGQKAPAFSLPGTDGETYTLDSFSDAEVLVMIFTCNHCPTAQAYEERMKQLVVDYQDRGVAVVAVSPNDPASVRLDELGYTDLSDSFEEMQIRAADMAYNFPYLYDGETQEMSKAYGPVATPHVFVFDRDRVLQYIGRIDDEERIGKAKTHDLRDALEAMLAGRPVANATTKTFGCSVKWADKTGDVQRAVKRWQEEPVSVETITIEGVKDLMKNDTNKLRVINIWATWCGPCVTEMPEFVDINRMYRGRRFELITISMDGPELAEDVLDVLKRNHVSSKNYHFANEDAYALIEALDPEWPGPIPYTVLIKPGGEIVFRQLSKIDPLELKREIVNHVGRYYD